MRRTTGYSIVLLLVFAILPNTSPAQVMAAQLNGNVIDAALLYEETVYNVSFELTSTEPEIIIRLLSADPTDDTALNAATYIASDSLLIFPTLVAGEQVYFDLQLTLVDAGNLSFRLDSFAESPDVILHNADIITLEESNPGAEAIALSGKNIVAVGNNDEILQLTGFHTKIIDLENHTLIPGFVDPHNHVFNAIFLQQEADLVGTSYAEAEQRLIEAGTTTLANLNVWPSAMTDFVTEFAGDGSSLRIRTNLYLGYNDVCGVVWPENWYADYAPNRSQRAMLRIPGLKIFMDGGVCGGPVFGAEENLYMQVPELAAVINQLQAQGYQTATHAVGPVTTRAVLDSLETALAGEPNAMRHRIEHNRFMYGDQFARYGEIGAIPVVFGIPMTCSLVDGGAWGFINDDNSPGGVALRPLFDAWRTLLDANPELPVSWKSDAVINRWPYQPFLQLWSMVTRQELREDGTVCQPPEWHLEKAVTTEEALRMMTINPAYALFMEDKIGSLRAGKFADLLLVSANPLEISTDDLRTINVHMTMIGGKVEYCTAESTAYCPQD